MLSFIWFREVKTPETLDRLLEKVFKPLKGLIRTMNIRLGFEIWYAATDLA